VENEQKPLDRKRKKRLDERFHNRLNEMYPSRENLPAAISIRQADELTARLHELEAKLAEQPSQPARERPAVGPTPASRPVRFPRLARVWDKLTGAHASIQETGDRQQAQLAAAISIGLGVFSFIGLVAGAMAKAMVVNTIALVAITILVFLNYSITRGRHYKWGSAALVVIFFVAGFGLALSNPGRESFDLFTMLPIALILGSLLVPLWGLGLLSVINFLAVMLFPYLAPAYPFSQAVVDAGIYLTLGILLTIAVAYRNSVERMRVAEVTTVNRELQAIQTSLEQRVEERTHDLELASEVGRIITEKVANLNELLTSAAELIRARFNLYYTQVYLTDNTGKTLLLRAGTGQVGQELLRRRHQLPVSLASLNGRAALERKPVIVADTAINPAFLPNPLLPNTRSEMTIPLVAGSQVIGVLDMQSETPGALNESNLPAFEALAGQLSVAIQNAGLFAQNQEARQQIESTVRRSTQAGWQGFLNGIDRSERIGYLFDQKDTIAVNELPGTNSRSCLNVPITITGAKVGVLQTAEEDRTWTAQDIEIIQATAARLGQQIESLRLLAQAEHYQADAEQAVRQLTHQGWESFLVKRQELAPGFVYDQKEVKPLDGNGDASSAQILKHPLVAREAAIGELAAEVDASSETATELLAAVANQLSSHIENLRLTEQNEKRAHEMETVAELSITTSTALDPDLLLQTIVDHTQERFGVYHAHIYLVDESLQTLNLAAGAGEVGRKMMAGEHSLAMDAEQSLVARAARERRAVIVDNARMDPGFLPNPFLPETRSEMAVPLIVGDKLLGVFDVQSDRLKGFSAEDASIYTTLASQVAVALQNARLYVEQAATVTKLRELDRLKSSFLANMSHELRTPLNSILGFSDVIMNEMDGPLTEEMSNDVKLINKNGQHLLHLINDVLDMAKIEAGRMNLAPETFNLNEVLNEALSITSSLAPEKDLLVQIEPDSDTQVEIFADRIRLRQILINLVNNSIKFTEKGKISIRACRQPGENLLITVKDTGIGIPSGNLEIIFQEFAQVDSSSTRKAGGTGLGLPISRRLVEMHGGRLWAESTGIPGEGSTFYVELPLVAKITEPIEKQEK
jgi:signal transduction histidine kinase